MDTLYIFNIRTHYLVIIMTFEIKKLSAVQLVLHAFSPSLTWSFTSPEGKDRRQRRGVLRIVVLVVCQWRMW